MDLLAALSLVLVLEGLALAVLARSLPEVLAAMEAAEPRQMRMIGIAMLVAGSVAYVMIRG